MREVMKVNQTLDSLSLVSCGDEKMEHDTNLKKE